MPGGLALALVVALGPGQAPSLSWDAPLECPDASWLEARVEAYLGRGTNTGSFAIHARVQIDQAEFVLILDTEVAGDRQHHRLRHHDCAAVSELAASLAAIAIDPLAGAGPVEPAPPPKQLGLAVRRRPSTDVPVQRPRTAAKAPAPVERPRGPLELDPQPPAPRSSASAITPASRPPELEPTPEPRFGPIAVTGATDRPAAPRPVPGQTQLSLAASGGTSLGLFPNVAPAVHAAIGLGYRPLARRRPGPARLGVQLDARGGATLAGRFRDSTGTVGGDMLAWDLGLRTCALPRWGALELRGCASVGAGQVRARGVGLETNLERNHPWLWLVPEAGAALLLGQDQRVALFADLGLSLNLLRPNFEIRAPDAAYSMPLVSGQVHAGVRVRVF